MTKTCKVIMLPTDKSHLCIFSDRDTVTNILKYSENGEKIVNQLKEKQKVLQEKVDEGYKKFLDNPEEYIEKTRDNLIIDQKLENAVQTLYSEPIEHNGLTEYSDELKEAFKAGAKFMQKEMQNEAIVVNEPQDTRIIDNILPQIAKGTFTISQKLDKAAENHSYNMVSRDIEHIGLLQASEDDFKKGAEFMKEEMQDEAIEFAEWVRNNCIFIYHNRNKLWRYFGDDKTYNSKQLYELWKQNK